MITQQQIEKLEKDKQEYNRIKQKLDDYLAKHPKARKSGQIKMLIRNMDRVAEIIADAEKEIENNA